MFRKSPLLSPPVPQIDFESEQANPLAQVTLPASLLSSISDIEAGTSSRINFMFFNSPKFFQVSDHSVTHHMKKSVKNI